MSTSVGQPQPLVGVEWVAQRLGITTQHAYEMARTGMIPSVRLGRLVRFDAGTVERYIAGGGQALPGGWRRDEG